MADKTMRQAATDVAETLGIAADVPMTAEQAERFKAEFERAIAEGGSQSAWRPSVSAFRASRGEVIARLAKAFGPHVAPVPRDTGNPRYDRGRFDYAPDGNDEQASTMIVFRDTDGQNSVRPLTYGEIADALCGNGQQEEPRA